MQEWQVNVLALLRKKYAGGFWLHSPIEMTRLQEAYREQYGRELPPPETIRAFFAHATVQQGNKVYLIDDETKERIFFCVQEYLESAHVIFYDSFFQCHQKWLTKGCIYDEAMLQVVLRELCPDLYYQKQYFGKVQGAMARVIEDELLYIWGDQTLWTYEMLEKRLYIPLGRIQTALTGSHSFLWVKAGTFALLSHVKIREETKKAVQEEAAARMAKAGFLHITEISIEDIVADNYELETKSNSALYDAMYYLCLEEDYDRKGNGLTPKHKNAALESGEKTQKISMIEYLCQYCLQQEVCSLSEVQEFAEQITPQNAKMNAIKALSRTMVRIDVEQYVADKCVSFDVEKTDEVLDAVVTDMYLPLRSFVAFGSFPACGRAWNLFLLESYCRRFSKLFRFDVPAPNKKCAGTVIRRTYTGEYEDLLADALSKNDIPLRASEAGDFLFEAGYLGKIPNASVLSRILRKAQKIPPRC